MKGKIHFTLVPFIFICNVLWIMKSKGRRVMKITGQLTHAVPRTGLTHGVCVHTNKPTNTAFPLPALQSYVSGILYFFV